MAVRKTSVLDLTAKKDVSGRGNVSVRGNATLCENSYVELLFFRHYCGFQTFSKYCKYQIAVHIKLLIILKCCKVP